MVILPPDGVSATIEANEQKIQAGSDSLTILPPGTSRISVHTGGTVARIVSRASRDVLALGVQQRRVHRRRARIGPARPLPEPFEGYRLRHYRLADYAKPNGEQIQPRVFRSTNMMVNIFVHYRTRRDTTALGPHWHDDFEQASLTLNGTWVHHMRYNWGSDIGAWRPDDHGEMATPSVIIIIPARAIHTSRDIGEDGPESSLYDIFCPRASTSPARRGSSSTRPSIPCPPTRTTAK